MEKHVKEWTLREGARVRAEISPCSWMHPDYGLQLTVSMEQSGDRVFPRMDTPFSDCTEGDFDVLCRSVDVMKCWTPDCRTLVFKDGRGKGLCEKCQAAIDDQKYAALAKEEAEKTSIRDAERKKMGYLFRGEVWIHPLEGEDLLFECYFKEEPTTEIVGEIFEGPQREAPTITVIRL